MMTPEQIQIVTKTLAECGRPRKEAETFTEEELAILINGDGPSLERYAVACKMRLDRLVEQKAVVDDVPEELTEETDAE